MLKKTMNAVKAFQQTHGLKANGNVTQETIDRMVAVAKTTPTPAPAAEPTPAP